MYAVVGHVTIDPGRMDEAEKMLNERVVPTVRAAKGFVSGTWTHSDDGEGVSIATFESEKDAQALVAMMQSMPAPDGSPVTIDSTVIYRVAATA